MFDFTPVLPDTVIRLMLIVSVLCTIHSLVMLATIERRQYMKKVRMAKLYAEVMDVPAHEALNLFSIQPRR